MSNDESDLAQARILLAALQENIIHATRMIEKFERQRPSGSSAGPQERVLWRELSQVHGHVDRIYERFPETRPSRSCGDVPASPRSSLKPYEPPSRF